MAHHRLATPDLGRIFRGETVTGLSEWQLLERYLECRDEGAFEALVTRHGPMVLGVCRRMLADRTDVEDAFQATFLVLVRRARHLGPHDAIGPWLYGVATRVAMRSRSEAARRRRFQPITSEVAAVDDECSIVNRETGEILDQELSRLPSKYRHPIVLCYLEGQTHEEAARQLKWPIGTVKGRLARARDLLQSRLVRRGLTPAVGALSLALSPDSLAAPHRELLDRTVKVSLELGLGKATTPIVSASITSLVEGVLTSMFFNTLKWTGVAAVLCGLAFTGVGVMARQDAGAKKLEAPPTFEAVADGAAQPAPPVRVSKVIKPPTADAQDAPEKLAELRRELLKTANSDWEQAHDVYVRMDTGLERAYHASKRLMDASQEGADNAAEKSAAVKAHMKRIRSLARAQNEKSSSSDNSSAQVKVYAAEAELWLARAETPTPRPEKEKESSSDAGIKGGRAKDLKSQLVLAKLDEPISMAFKDDTPLEDLLKYIKQVTTTKEYKGIPIYVDPIGLQEAEKSMTSTVRGMDLEGIPLRRTLQLLLNQIDLAYFVEDGILYITSAEGEKHSLGPPMHEPSPIELKLEKAERGELTVKEMAELIELLKARAEVTKLTRGVPEGKGGAQ
jgi:RNA polymerase sigma factor (sigma-70 family)